jgi:uncharacterized short protein YbdD (DUF466 family)
VSVAAKSQLPAVMRGFDSKLSLAQAVPARAASAAKRIGRALRRVWLALRQMTGDAAYETYLRHAAIRRVRSGDANARGARPLSRRDFYLDSLRRRYSTISRCC